MKSAERQSLRVARPHGDAWCHSEGGTELQRAASDCCFYLQAVGSSEEPLFFLHFHLFYLFRHTHTHCSHCGDISKEAKAIHATNGEAAAATCTYTLGKRTSVAALKIVAIFFFFFCPALFEIGCNKLFIIICEQGLGWCGFHLGRCLGGLAAERNTGLARARVQTHTHTHKKQAKQNTFRRSRDQSHQLLFLFKRKHSIVRFVR